MNSIRYFRASINDVALVVQQRLDVLQIFQGAQSPEAIEALRPQLNKTIFESLQNNLYVAWLAEADGSIVGSGGMSIRQQPGNFSNPTGRTGYLMSMYTLPEFRGRGICGELVRRLVCTGQEMGIEFFELHSTPAGEPVYQKLGFLLHPEPTYRMRSLISSECSGR
jgi:GNAT superfamily N-acetyltransferase